MRYGLHSIPPGRAGTDATLAAIGQLIAQSQRRPNTRIAALSILEKHNIDPRNQAAAMAALFTWIKRTIRYVLDPIDVETVQSPEITMKLRAGDCDDQATLMAAFAANLGIPARLVTIGPTADQMIHIFPEILLGGRWTAADTTINKPFGFRSKLPAVRVYDLRGQKIMSMGTAMQVLPIRKSELQSKIYLAAYNQMELNWARGVINRADVASYLRVIYEGNSPFKGTFADPPVRKAIVDYLSRIDQSGAQSSKPAGQLNGMEGMSGFLSSIVKAVGSVVKGAINLVTGGGKTPITINPTINVPPGTIQTTVSPEAAKAGVSELFSNPMFLAAAAVVAVMLFTRK